MSVIIAEIKPFDMNQKVYIKHENGEGRNFSITIDNLPILISDLTFTENINKVHLFGNAVYCDEIADEIYSECIHKYSNNNIEIEVN